MCTTVARGRSRISSADRTAPDWTGRLLVWIQSGEPLCNVSGRRRYGLMNVGVASCDQIVHNIGAQPVGTHLQAADSGSEKKLETTKSEGEGR